MLACSLIRRSTLALALVMATAATASAHDALSPDGTVIRRTKLEQACGPALTRFCPALSDTPGNTRNQVICLKPYRSSLQPYCRAAVNAAMK